MAAALPKRNQTRKDKSFVEKIWDKLHDFFDNENYVDVTFLWRSNKKRVTAHRLILAASSAFFDELFQTPRGIAPAIYIENITPEAFELLVAYCYTGKLFPRKKNVTELLNGATILKLKAAADICVSYIKGDKKVPEIAIASQLATTSRRNTNTASSTVARSLSSRTTTSTSTRNAPVANSILAVRKCDLQKDKEGLIYRCDESVKKWLQFGVLTFPRKLADYAYANKSFISFGGLEDGRPTNRVDSYNFIAQTWQPLAPMITPRSELCVTKIHTIIYAIGGSDAESKALSTVEKFDLRNTNKVLWTSLPNMLTPRRKATAVTVELIYVIGGFGIEWKPLRSVECFNTKTSTWSKCADMHDARHDCGATVINGFIYVMGSGNVPPYSPNVEYYDPRKNSWTKVVPLNVARFGICGVTFCGQVVAIGGFLPNYYKGVVEIYNRRQNAWTRTMTLPSGGNYKCFIVPTEELTKIDTARKLRIPNV